MLTKTAVSLGRRTLRAWPLECLPLSMTCTAARNSSELKAFKAQVDPNNILNPGKFFGVDSKGSPPLIFHPAVFGPSMQSHGAAVAGDRENGDHCSWERIRRSTTWISSSASMPAPNAETAWRYVLPISSPRMKALTAKGKIALAKKLLAGQDVTPGGSGQCLYVHALQGLRGDMPDQPRTDDALGRPGKEDRRSSSAGRRPRSRNF